MRAEFENKGHTMKRGGIPQSIVAGHVFAALVVALGVAIAISAIGFGALRRSDATVSPPTRDSNEVALVHVRSVPPEVRPVSNARTTFRDGLAQRAWQFTSRLPILPFRTTIAQALSVRHLLVTALTASLVDDPPKHIVYTTQNLWSTPPGVSFFCGCESATGCGPGLGPGAIVSDFDNGTVQPEGITWSDELAFDSDVSGGCDHHNLPQAPHCTSPYDETCSESYSASGHAATSLSVVADQDHIAFTGSTTASHTGTTSISHSCCPADPGAQPVNGSLLYYVSFGQSMSIAFTPKRDTVLVIGSSTLDVDTSEDVTCTAFSGAIARGSWAVGGDTSCTGVGSVEYILEETGSKEWTNPSRCIMLTGGVEHGVSLGYASSSSGSAQFPSPPYRPFSCATARSLDSTFNAEFCFVRGLEFDPTDRLCPNGKDTTTLRVAGGEACGSVIKWIVEGDDVVTYKENGASIEFTARDRTGVARIRAQFGESDCCYLEAFLPVGCTDCQDCDVAGNANATIGKSLMVGFSLGSGAEGETAGTLRLHADKWDAVLATPQALQFLLARPDVEVVRGVHQDVLQIVTPAILANVVKVNSTNYQVEFYDDLTNLSAPTGDFGEYDVSGLGDPYTTWDISANLSNKTLTLTQTDGSANLREYVYTYAEASGTEWTWELKTIDPDGPATVQTETEAWSFGTSLSTRSYMVAHGGSEYYRVAETWSAYGWREHRQAVASRTVDPNDAALAASYDYYTGPDIRGRLKTQINADGSWVTYDYDSEGRVEIEVRGWGDDDEQDIPDPPSTSVGRAFAHVYYPNGPDESDIEVHPTVPRVTTEYIEGAAVSKTYRAFVMDSGNIVEVEERCPDLANSYGDTDNLVTLTTYDGTDLDRVTRIDYPDGRADVYVYDDADVTFSFTPGSTPPWSAPTYDLDDEEEGFHYVAVTHLGPSGGVAGKSTREVTITDKVGNVVLEEMWATENGTDYTVAAWSASVHDSRGRVTHTYGSDSSLVSTTYTDCCGADSVTDASGIETVYETDLIGRRQSVTKVASTNIVTAYGYSIASGERIEEIATTADSLSIETSRRYDLAGRLVAEVDEAGLETSHVYSATTEGGLKVTTTHPDGSTRITEHYRDGRVKRVSGTAVVGQFYEYGVESGLQFTKAFIGPDFGSSLRCTKTFYDALGRVASEIRPGWIDSGTTDVTTNYTYDDVGQLAKTETSINSSLLMAATLYEYDDLGNLIRTALDLGETPNGVIDLGTDRILSDSETEYQSISNAWWRVTTTRAYPNTDPNTADDPVVTGVERIRLSGFAGSETAEVESEDIHGNVTVTTTETNRSTKTVTVTAVYPDATGTAETITTNGLLLSSESRTGVLTEFDYDALGRRTVVTDPRTGDVATTYETGTNRVQKVEKLDGSQNVVFRTTYEYFTDQEDHPGRLKAVKQYVDGSTDVYTRYDYNSRGQITHVWGEVPQPVKMDYDNYGQRTHLHTYRGGSGWNGTTWPVSPGTADTTEWIYDPATGLLNAKEYADETQTVYEYEPDGRLAKRTWARPDGMDPLDTTYTYASDTGEMTAIDYSDGTTPNVDFTYNRIGGLATVADAVGERTFTLNSTLQVMTEEVTDPDLHYFKITREYEPYIEDQGGEGGPGGGAYLGNIVGRPKKLKIGNPESPDYQTEYFYDPYNARLTSITGPGLPSSGAAYTYEADSDLVSQIDFKAGGTTLARTLFFFDDHRDAVTDLRNRWIPSNLAMSRYRYAYDTLGRREYVTRTGEAFADSNSDIWTYNERNELTVSERYLGAGTPPPTTQPVATLDREYDYDPIGNRTRHKEGTSADVYYCANELNQYDTLDDTSSCPPSAPIAETLSYDEDGNLISDGSYRYEWDAENRLSVVWLVDPTPGTDEEGDRKLEFTYDYMSRRVQKRDRLYSSSAWTTTLDRKFVYDGWNVLLELDGLNSNAIVRKFTWGPDISGLMGGAASGSFDSAGGIGGLLAVSTGTTDEDYLYMYDANGNVGQLIAWANDYGNASGTGWHSDRIVARYEYDAYGTVIGPDTDNDQMWQDDAGPYAVTNPFRFSTKWFDDETDLGYWGYRYYSPRIGRWLTRDPIEEGGGWNLYSALSNDTPNRIDTTGRQDLVTSSPSQVPPVVGDRFFMTFEWLTHDQCGNVSFGARFHIVGSNNQGWIIQLSRSTVWLEQCDGTAFPGYPQHTEVYEAWEYDSGVVYAGHQTRGRVHDSDVYGFAPAFHNIGADGDCSKGTLHMVGEQVAFDNATLDQLGQGPWPTIGHPLGQHSSIPWTNRGPAWGNGTVHTRGMTYTWNCCGDKPTGHLRIWFDGFEKTESW